MSVTFVPVDADGWPVGDDTSAVEPCLCAQLAPSWTYPCEAPDVDDLAAHADPRCRRCDGTGLERIEGIPDPDTVINLSNANARALLALLGWAPAPSRLPLRDVADDTVFAGADALVGRRATAEARRAVMRARALFDRLAPALVRHSEEVVGAPVVREDGSVELRPVRVYARGLDEDGLRQRLEAFAALVERGVARGAAAVMWG